MLASNLFGFSVPSDAVYGTPVVQPPLAPTSVRGDGVNVATNAVNVTWMSPPSAVNYYNITAEVGECVCAACIVIPSSRAVRWMRHLRVCEFVRVAAALCQCVDVVTVLLWAELEWAGLCAGCEC